MLGRADFTLLANQLAGIAGRFILSINDTLGVRDVFAQFDIESAETTYTVGSSVARKTRELIIRNI